MYTKQFSSVVGVSFDWLLGVNLVYYVVYNHLYKMAVSKCMFN